MQLSAKVSTVWTLQDRALAFCGEAFGITLLHFAAFRILAHWCVVPPSPQEN
jgi:hypothetical protein